MSRFIFVLASMLFLSLPSFANGQQGDSDQVSLAATDEPSGQDSQIEAQDKVGDESVSENADADAADADADEVIESQGHDEQAEQDADADVDAYSDDIE